MLQNIHFASFEERLRELYQVTHDKVPHASRKFWEFSDDEETNRVNGVHNKLP